LQDQDEPNVTAERSRSEDRDAHRVRHRDAGTAGADVHTLHAKLRADGQRRTLDPLAPATTMVTPSAPSMPPLLAKLISEHADTGLPPAYVPKDERAVEPATDEGGVS
jgi:hypothetical protein